jgi:hypothetical protein
MPRRGLLGRGGVGPQPARSAIVATKRGEPMLRFVKKVLSRARDRVISPVVGVQQSQLEVLNSLNDLLMRVGWEHSLSTTKNPLNRFGAKSCSQADEDGITLEITKRLGISAGMFVELGDGDGLENNTLVLLLNGWRGFWIGGQDLGFNHKLNLRKLSFFKAWITIENVIGLMEEGFQAMGTNELDVLSLDLDGNDYSQESFFLFTMPSGKSEYFACLGDRR